MEEVYVGLGSNIGDRANFLRQAVQKMMNLEGTENFLCSSIWQTEPWGTTGQEKYLNAAVRFFTQQNPEELLQHLQQIEQALGRSRPYRWAPRTIDLDILLYGKQVIHTPRLTVPHPLMKQRLFVLTPLEELNAALQFPDGGNLQETLDSFRKAGNMAGIVRTNDQWF